MIKEKTKNMVEELCCSSVQFKTIFDEATSKIEELINKRNTARSVRTKNSCDMIMSIKVETIPLTKEEITVLRTYIEEKYIDHVAGDYICISKCIFSNNYSIKSKYSFIR